MWTEDAHGYALEFRETFLEISAKALPGVVWRDLSICEVEYPSPSPVLGPLRVAFESDRVSLYCGRHHLHVPSTRVTFAMGSTRSLQKLSALSGNSQAMPWLSDGHLTGVGPFRRTDQRAF
jgi:hypothetical protein